MNLPDPKALEDGALQLDHAADQLGPMIEMLEARCATPPADPAHRERWEQNVALLAPDLRAGQWVLADRAYDADYLRAHLQQVGAQAVIPGKKNRTQAIAHDKEIYKHRNQIERCINRLKAYRGLATRFEKTAAAYLALVTLAAICMWL